MAKFVCNFISYTLKRTVDITVVIPTVTIPEAMGMTGDFMEVNERADIGDMTKRKGSCSHTPKKPYPVLYLLHGMGNNHATWTGYTNAELFAEERNIVLVMMSAENKCYIDAGGDDFYDFLEKELHDFVTGMFPVSKRPEDTYIAGLSMGGFGTLVHAFSNPERYRACGAFSAAVELNPAMLTGQTDTGINPDYDPTTLAKRLIEKKSIFPDIYIACGENDFLFDMNNKFVSMLKENGVNIVYDILPGYGHEWRFWNIEIEKFLDHIQSVRTDAYVGIKRQI